MTRDYVVGGLIVIFYLLLLIVLLKIGLKPAFLGLEAGLRRLWEGPRRDGPTPKPKGCLVLHETAALEIEVYDKIVSADILEHMKSCNLYPRRPQPRLPDPTYRAGKRSVQIAVKPHEHHWTEEVTLSGSSFALCDTCGKRREEA